MVSFRFYENKLKEYLVRRVKNPNDVAAAIRKYGNLSFSIDVKRFDRPHIIVRTGISEAVFDLDTGIIISGGLAVGGNEIKSWIMTHLKKQEIKAVWQTEHKKYLAELEKIKEAEEERHESL